jgi:hypothetical protein
MSGHLISSHAIRLHRQRSFNSFNSFNYFSNFALLLQPADILAQQTRHRRPSYNHTPPREPPRRNMRFRAIDRPGHRRQPQRIAPAGDRVVDRAQPGQPARCHQQPDLGSAQRGNKRERILVAHGHRPHPGLDIIHRILARVHVIENHHPDRLRRGQTGRRQRHRRILRGERLDAQRGARQEHRPRQRHTQHDLREIRHPLGQRVQTDQRVDGDRMPETLRRVRELRHHGRPGRRDRPVKDMPLERGHGAARDRSQLAPADLAVEVAVEDIVDDAGCAAEEDVPDEKGRAGAEQEARRDDGLGDAGGIAEADEVGEVKTVKTTGLFDAHQFRVGHPRARKD